MSGRATFDNEQHKSISCFSILVFTSVGFVVGKSLAHQLNLEHSSISFPASLNDLQLAGEEQSDTNSTSDPLHLIFSCLPKSSGTNHCVS
jgi:hypothetical protein